MEKILFVKNNDLDEVNEHLKQGGRIKMIQPIAECVSSYGYANGRDVWAEEKGSYTGNVYAYIVVEFN